MEKTDRVYLWCEAPPDKKMHRLTKGESYAVTGGTEKGHDLLVGFTEMFAKRIRENFPKSEADFDATARDVMEKAFGPKRRKKRK